MAPTYYSSIPEDIQAWMLAQPVFFIASAPLLGKHINVSPKGHPSRTLRILNANEIAYLDTTGSGCETISHLYENGRATVMFNSFGPSPRILRLFCTGRVVERGQSEFDAFTRSFEELAMENTSRLEEGSSEGDWQAGAIKQGARSVIVLHVFKVQTTCGFGVPILGTSLPTKKAEALTKCVDGQWLDRDTLATAAGKKKGPAMHAYWKENNCRSLDGLLGLKAARRMRGEVIGAAEVRAVVRRVVVGNWSSVLVGFVLAMVVLVALGLVDEVKVKEFGQQVPRRMRDVANSLPF